MGQLRPLILRRAGAADYRAVRSLLMEASRWLGTKGTDQWAVPWPDENGRNERVRGAIEAGRTWIAWDGACPAATLTASPNDHGIWPEETGLEPAVYVRRITVSRRYAGQGLGGQLLDWAGLRASRSYGARWIRVDVWTTNVKLHDYYLDQGFEECGLCPITGYPSAALFQKRIADIQRPEIPLFHEESRASQATWPDELSRHDRPGDHALPGA
jgi:GNAT superfamily N-acetyltransferase